MTMILERLKYALAWLALNSGRLVSQAILYGIPVALAVGLLYYIIFKPWIFLGVMVIFILALGMAWAINRFNIWFDKKTTAVMDWSRATVNKNNAKDD